MNIILVDDDPFVALSLKTILEAQPDIHILATGSNGLEAIELFTKHKPDILLMDIRMEQLNGLDAASTILQQDHSAKILLLTTFADDEYILKAIHLGAKGYILKQAFESIAPALHAVYNGQTVFGNQIMDKIPELMSNTEKLDPAKLNLTDKEFAILELVADGLNNKEIATKLFLSEGTVRNYISNTLLKLDLRDRTQLACFYYKHIL